MDIEKRESPDGQSVAIRTENAPDAWNAWAVMHRRVGGHFAPNAEVQSWKPLVVDPEWVEPEE